MPNQLLVQVLCVQSNQVSRRSPFAFSPDVWRVIDFADRAVIRALDHDDGVDVIDFGVRYQITRRNEVAAIARTGDQIAPKMISTGCVMTKQHVISVELPSH